MDVRGASGGGGGARQGRNLFGIPSSPERDERTPSPAGDVPGDGMDLAHRATAELRAADNLMADAQRVANFGSWEWRVLEDAVVWSKQLYTIFGLDATPQSVPFRVTFATYLERVHPDDEAVVRSAIESALSDTKPFRFQHRIARPNGEERMVRCQGEPVVDPVTGAIVRVVGVCQDVTELATVERARSEADARFRSAFENAPIGIALVDFSGEADGRLTEVNRSLCELTGRSPAELIGSSMTALSLAEDAAIDQDLRERLIAGEIDRFSVEKRALRSDDRLVWLQMSISTVPEVAPGKTAGIVQVQDVTERKRFEEQLRYIADHDSLTGLMNRRRFREELDSHLALRRRYGGQGALLLVDVDRLKAVNDSRGHGAGDVVLRRVAEAMRGRVRSTDVVARLAGDEFAVLLPSVEASEAMTLGEALISRVAIEEIAGWGVSISVGVAPFGGGDVGTTEDVMAIADAAMYRAKQRGGAVAELAETPIASCPHSRTEPSFEPRAPRQAPDPGRISHDADGPSTLVDRVRRALESGALLVYGQPVVDLRSGAVAHHELLVRMRHETTGQVLSASDFLGAAAQAEGLCFAIDLWVVDRALEMLSDGSRGARFQVNLSGETLADEEHLERLLAKVDAADVESGAIGFEIGEGSVQRDVVQATAALERLAATGCPLVLDGFSAGFGSFEYLQQLPVDQIKIDGSVVRALLGDAPDHATIRAIVRLAQGTSKTTVAKLVESETMVPILRMHGVDMAQGFELGEPVPLVA